MGTSTASGSERQTAKGDPAKSFAEEALRLSGKSEEETRRTGAVDKADEQVESMFAPQYQTANSPVHRAVWERRLPLELFTYAPTPPSVNASKASPVESSAMIAAALLSEIPTTPGAVLLAPWMPTQLLENPTTPKPSNRSGKRRSCQRARTGRTSRRCANGL